MKTAVLKKPLFLLLALAACGAGTQRIASLAGMKHTFALINTLLLVPLAVLHAGPEARPTVGSFRWDGWYGKGSVTKAVEALLGQPKYHFRLPWFARVIGEEKVSINGDSQAIVEQEIDYGRDGRGKEQRP